MCEKVDKKAQTGHRGCMRITMNCVVSPPAEGVTVFEIAGIDQATALLQPLDDVFVSILKQKKKILKAKCHSSLWLKVPSWLNVVRRAA